MPRTKLGSPTPAQQRATFNRIMRMAMAANDIPDLTALAPRLSMTRQAPCPTASITAAGSLKRSVCWFGC